MVLNEISFKSSMPIGQVHGFERNIVQEPRYRTGEAGSGGAVVRRPGRLGQAAA